MSKYKQEKEQFNEMLINIATGSVNPTELNATLQALRKTSGLLFDTIDTLEGDKVQLTALLDTEKDLHEKLKTKFHENWEQDGGKDDHEDENLKIEVPLTEEEVIREFARLSQPDKEEE